jgi:energy-coupling factor transporter ATP-binding protein EcfA2
MVKKQKVRSGPNASKRTRSAKATARRPGVRTVKKKLRTPPARAAKKQKLRSKRRTGLHAKGGGNATAAGVTFQASVGAVFAVQMLTESFGDEQLGLTPFKVKSIRFESDAPLDDIVVETDQDGWLLIQAKTKLSLSSSLTSEFGKTAEQIVRQWNAGLAGKGARSWDRPLNVGRDRLIIAVGPGTSQTITTDLAKALSSLRAQATAPLPAKQRAVLRTLSVALKAAWKAVTGKNASDTDITAILPLIAVMRFDMAGPDRKAAIAQMRLLTLQAPSAHGAFVATERQCQALMERRHGADSKAFRHFIAQAGVSLKAAPSYQADVAQLKLHSTRIAAELDAFEITIVDGRPIAVERVATNAVFRAAKGGSLLVIGEPGSGKSAVVSAAASALRKEKCEVIQFSVDRLPVDTADGLRDELGLTHRLPDLLQNWPGTKPAYLFIDALDATRGGRGEAVFRSLIKDVMALPGYRWRVIASIRSFDLKLGEQFRDLFAGTPPDDQFKDSTFPAVRHINVPVWSEAEFTQLLSQAKSLTTAIAHGGKKLRDLAGVPFNTRLLADLLATGLSASAFGEVKSQVELLAMYWSRRVTPLGNAADVCLRAALELMVTTHTLQAERLPVASVAPSALDGLFKANVLVPVVGDRYVGFRHHILFDYAASRLFIDPLNIGAITTRLLAQPGLALMLAPALAYALHDIWLNSTNDRVGFWTAVVELTGQSPSDPVARSIAARMASELPVEANDLVGLVAFLNSAGHREKAAKAFSHIVGSVTVRVEDGMLSTFAPWCRLAAEASAHVDVIAWPLRTLLFLIVGKVTDADQRAQLGQAARALLIFALTNQRAAQLVTVGIDLVGDTYETDVVASRALLSQLLTEGRFANHAHEDIPPLARKAKHIAAHDPDFAVEIYRVAFTQRVLDTSATSMGNSQILSLASNKKQDYDHARWQLAQYVPGFLERNPDLGVRVLIAALEGQLVSEHPTDAEEQSITVAGQTVALLDDGSRIWAHDPDDRYAHADNGASMIETFKKRLLNAPATNAVNLAQLAIANNRMALVWARMFLAAARRPDVLGHVMWPFASSLQFLRSSDTRKDAIDAVAAVYSTVSPADKRQFEDSVFTIPFDGYENPERAKQRFLATLFGAIGDDKLETDAAKQLLSNAVTASVPRGNERPFSIFTETNEVEPYYWLTQAGVDIESDANAGLLRLVEAAPGRPKPDGTHSASVAEGARALIALADALQNSEPPSPSQMVIDHARTTLLQGCENLARRKSELHAAPDVVRSLASLVEPYLEVGASTAAPAESQTSLRAAAVEAALLLCSEETATRLTPKIEPLLTDEAEKVRAAIAEDMGQLWDVARPTLWRFAEYFARDEQSFTVLQHFTLFLVRAVHHAPEQVETLSIELMPRARRESEPRGDRIIEGIGNLIAILWLRYERPRSRQLLTDWQTDLVAHEAELNRAAATLRDTVILGYGTTNEADIRMRRNAQRLALEFVEASAPVIARYIAMDPASRTEADHQAARAAAHLLNNVGDQLYFSSGAFRADEKEEPTGLVTAESKKAFLDETAELLRRIGDVGTPHTIYYLIDLLASLRLADPPFVFDLVAHALLDAGRMHGFQFESLGADRFVEVVGIFLADHRDVFNDQPRRAKLIECLDAFVEVGWPKARRLLYRLPELL